MDEQRGATGMEEREGQDALRVLILGAGGKVGGFLHRAWSGDASIKPTGWTRRDLDLTKSVKVAEMLEAMAHSSHPVQAIINCAALANPGRCEQIPEEAHMVNAELPRLLAEHCTRHDVRLIHLSTDYVLDGTVPGLKGEAAQTAPNGCYGRTKLAGEQAVLSSCPSAVVARVAWVFGGNGPGFLETIIQRAQQGQQPLEAVADKFSSPTCALDLADWLARILLEEPDLRGVIHLTHPGPPESWHSYGTKALKLAQEHGHLPVGVNIEVIPRSMEEVFGDLSGRPIHTAIHPETLTDRLGWQLRTWEQAASRLLAGQAELEQAAD